MTKGLHNRTAQKPSEDVITRLRYRIDFLFRSGAITEAAENMQHLRRILSLRDRPETGTGPSPDAMSV